MLLDSLTVNRAWATLGDPPLIHQNRDMNTISPSTSRQIFPDPRLKVRFGRLLRWYFFGCFLLIQILIANRIWGGWRPLALARMLAIQLFFTPRILLGCLVFSIITAVISERLIRWIAQPLCVRWLTPNRGLPAESELPLFIRVGEVIEKSFRARIKAEHSWEPGWLILTDQRLFWLSGIWRTTSWEVDRRLPSDPVIGRIDLQRPPKWLAGFVVGLPPRVRVHMKPTSYPEDDRFELLALGEPESLLDCLDPDLVQAVRTEHAGAEQNPLQPFSCEIWNMPVSQLQKSATPTCPLAIRNVELPPVREKPIKVVKPPKKKTPVSLITQQNPCDSLGIELPPLRRQA